jgi:hypothetical protein
MMGNGRFTMRHEYWSDGSGDSFFPVFNTQAREMLPPDAVFVWSVDAPDWVTAMTLYYEFRGWAPYKAMDGGRGEYTEEQERQARR